MFWRWGVGLRRAGGLVRNSPPGSAGDLRIAGLTRLWYIYRTYCAVYLQMSTLYSAHSTLTHRDTHVPDLQILGITVAHHCARVSQRRGRRGSALGCVVLPDRHTVMYSMYCAVQYSVRTYSYSAYRAAHAENVPPVRFCETDGDAQKPNIAHASSAPMYTLRTTSEHRVQSPNHLISFLPNNSTEKGHF